MDISEISSSEYERNQSEYCNYHDNNGSISFENSNLDYHDDNKTLKKEYEIIPLDASLFDIHDFLISPMMKHKVKVTLDQEKNTVELTTLLDSLTEEERDIVFQLLAQASRSDVSFEQSRGVLAVKYKVKANMDAKSHSPELQDQQFQFTPPMKNTSNTSMEKTVYTNSK